VKCNRCRFLHDPKRGSKDMQEYSLQWRDESKEQSVNITYLTSSDCQSSHVLLLPQLIIYEQFIAIYVWFLAFFSRFQHYWHKLFPFFIEMLQYDWLWSGHMIIKEMFYIPIKPELARASMTMSDVNNQLYDALGPCFYTPIKLQKKYIQFL
jgi:hypothetical protein